MSLKKPNDVATFYTELAEVSLTNALLYIRLLDDAPDNSELERHRRQLKAKLPGSGYNSLIDLLSAESDYTANIKLLLPQAARRNKVAVLTKSVISVSGGEKLMLFSKLSVAMEWLKGE
jgi:hypothetical protein